MRVFSENLKDLRELYVYDLQKALSMEQQILKALPLMIEKASDPELKSAFETHLNETHGHVSEVEGILANYDLDSSVTCKSSAALIMEASDSMKDAADPSVMDVTLIACAQKVEHHEIAVYGTLRTWAGILGETEHAAILEDILKEEKQTDLILTGISGYVNASAETPQYATSASN